MCTDIMIINLFPGMDYKILIFTIIISLIIVLCIVAVAVAIIFQMTENDYKKAANKEQNAADDIELIKNNFNKFTH